MAIRALPADYNDGAQPLLAPESPTLIFKHSPSCGVSIRAHSQVSTFAKAHPDYPVIQLDVIRQRKLSQEVAAGLALVHESPQAILVANGQVAWSASHGRVTARAIEAAVESVR